jgi:hypothetical protein
MRAVLQIILFLMFFCMYISGVPSKINATGGGAAYPQALVNDLAVKGVGSLWPNTGDN